MRNRELILDKTKIFKENSLTFFRSLPLLRLQRRQQRQRTAAKRRQNGGGGEPKSYRVTISAPIIFHCRSTTEHGLQTPNEAFFH